MAAFLKFRVPKRQERVECTQGLLLLSLIRKENPRTRALTLCIVDENRVPRPIPHLSRAKGTEDTSGMRSILLPWGSGGTGMAQTVGIPLAIRFCMVLPNSALLQQSEMVPSHLFIFFSGTGV
jgi:hypothetical protein